MYNLLNLLYLNIVMQCFHSGGGDGGTPSHPTIFFETPPIKTDDPQGAHPPPKNEAPPI